MIDPISYFTGAALLSGVIETGKMALSGVIGNSVNTAVWRAIPEIHQWYQGEGQPVNHHLQRALRTAYIAATEQVLEQARREVDEDTVPWCYQALQWVKNQSDLLKDETCRPLCHRTDGSRRISSSRRPGMPQREWRLSASLSPAC
jgi:hypothetical protein